MRFKELADRKVEITEADLEAIVAEELGTGIVHRFTIARASSCTAARAPTPTARVVLDRRRRQGRGDGTGDGMIDAAIAAIAEATGVDGHGRSTSRSRR